MLYRILSRDLPNQTRDWFVQRYPRDLQVILPDPGKEGVQQPRLVPRAGRGTDPPAWLERYGLGGHDFTEEVTDGALLEAGRSSLAEERMQTLATMVLLGINRIVVSDGQIKAKLQFHAAADETVSAQINQLGAQQAGIAGAERSAGAGGVDDGVDRRRQRASRCGNQGAAHGRSEHPVQDGDVSTFELRRLAGDSAHQPPRPVERRWRERKRGPQPARNRACGRTCASS